MEICIAYMRGAPVILRLENNLVYIDDELQPMNGLTKEHLEDFSKSIASIPFGPDHEGYKALINAKRAAFLSTLLGYAVGDECVDKISHILDSVHYDVLEYLGEYEED